MSDSSVVKLNQTNGVHQHFHSGNFETKNMNSLQDILETIKKHCIQFQSFSDLKRILCQVFFEFSCNITKILK